MHSKSFIKICFIGLISLQIAGCSALGVATTAGAVGGIAAAREGGLTQSATDTRIALEINDLWFKYDIAAFSKLNLTVDQGRVLVTGVVQDPDMRVEAVRLAWQPKGVAQVINEVRVEESDGISGYARDSWITSRLRSKLIFDRDVQSINYSIDTVKSTVYLMGIAQDQAELNKVIAHARETGYVKQVISYVKMAGEPVEGVQDPVKQDHQYNSFNQNNLNTITPAAGGGAPVPVTPSYGTSATLAQMHTTPNAPRDRAVHAEKLND